MGESKRRKLLDQNYGKNKPLSLGIKTSEHSGNYIVFCQHCGYWIDSATEYDDAILVKNAVEKIAAIDPLRSYSFDPWQKWSEKHWKELPVVDAVTWRITSEAEKRAIFNGIHPETIGAERTTFFKLLMEGDRVPSTPNPSIKKL